MFVPQWGFLHLKWEFTQKWKFIYSYSRRSKPVWLFLLWNTKIDILKCVSVLFFFIHPNHESQWGLWLFWTPLTFIICTKIVLFCSTKEKKASLFVFLNHSEASEIHTAALNHIVRTTIWSFSLRRFHHECVNWPLTEQLFGCTSPVQSVACVPHVMSSYYCSRWNLRKSGTSSIQSIQF